VLLFLNKGRDHSERLNVRKFVLLRTASRNTLKLHIQCLALVEVHALLLAFTHQYNVNPGKGIFMAGVLARKNVRNRTPKQDITFNLRERLCFSSCSRCQVAIQLLRCNCTCLKGMHRVHRVDSQDGAPHPKIMNGVHCGTACLREIL